MESTNERQVQKLKQLLERVQRNRARMAAEAGEEYVAVPFEGALPLSAPAAPEPSMPAISEPSAPIVHEPSAPAPLEPKVEPDFSDADYDEGIVEEATTDEALIKLFEGGGASSFDALPEPAPAVEMPQLAATEDLPAPGVEVVPEAVAPAAEAGWPEVVIEPEASDSELARIESFGTDELSLVDDESKTVEDDDMLTLDSIVPDEAPLSAAEKPAVEPTTLPKPEPESIHDLETPVPIEAQSPQPTEEMPAPVPAVEQAPIDVEGDFFEPPAHEAPPSPEAPPLEAASPEPPPAFEDLAAPAEKAPTPAAQPEPAPGSAKPVTPSRTKSIITWIIFIILAVFVGVGGGLAYNLIREL